jgi:hypothetical protein
MTVCVKEDGLGSRINAACRGYARIEGYREIDVEFVLDVFRRIIPVIHHNDGERYFIPVFFCKRFEIGDIETGAGAIGVKEMYEYRLVAWNGQFPAEIDGCPGTDGVI